MQWHGSDADQGMGLLDILLLIIHIERNLLPRRVKVQRKQNSPVPSWITFCVDGVRPGVQPVALRNHIRIRNIPHWRRQRATRDHLNGKEPQNINCTRRSGVERPARSIAQRIDPVISLPICDGNSPRVWFKKIVGSVGIVNAKNLQSSHGCILLHAGDDSGAGEITNSGTLPLVLAVPAQLPPAQFSPLLRPITCGSLLLVQKPSLDSSSIAAGFLHGTLARTGPG
mmetsp:Transcript_61889/g.142544  ORF Transcript_61889/g.142544 Transcript_61889/m.142544 type:complete len:227 (-) Transcript_61889:407-1087(-)